MGSISIIISSKISTKHFLGKA